MVFWNNMPVGLFIALFGYLLGSVPTGLLLTKLFSKGDPRHAGSQNIGATNIYRTAGKKLGILTLAGDVLKGVIPIGIAMRFVGEQWGLPADVWIAVAGLSPIVGHIFPIFLGFKGGKRCRYRSGHLSPYFAYCGAHRSFHLFRDCVEV